MTGDRRTRGKTRNGGATGTAAEQTRGPAWSSTDSPIKQFAENDHAVGQGSLEFYLG